MTRVERWLLSEKRRHAVRPRLEDALFARRPITYVAFRLRFVALRVVLRTALHLIEIAALSYFLLPKALVPILLLRHLSSLAQTLWWGALEPQRIALREAHRRRDEGAFSSICNRWNSFARFVALAELGATSLWFLVPGNVSGARMIYGAYAAACGWRLCLDTWSRTQHSAVYAVSRVQRPLYSLLLVDFLEVFGLLWAWLRIGPFALAVVLAMSGTVRCLFTLYFTERTRRQLGLPAGNPTPWRQWARSGWLTLPWMQLLKYAALNASLQVESIIIIVLGFCVSSEAGALLSMTIHSFSPLLGGGYAWSRVFYFDFKRIEGFGEAFFALRMGRLLDRVALVFPLILLGLVLPVAAVLSPDLVPDSLLAVAAFVVARSLFAVRQMEAFGYVDWRVQMRQAIVLGVTLATVALSRPRHSWLLWAVTSAFLLAAVGGRRARLFIRRETSETSAGLEAWLEWLKNCPQAWRLVTMVVDRSTTTMGRFRLAMRKSGHAAPIVRVGHSQWVTTVDAECSESQQRARILEASGGALLKLTFGLEGDRAKLMARLRESEFLPKEIDRASVVPAGSSRDAILQLEREFADSFPQGRCLSERSGGLAHLSGIEGTDLPRILHKVLADCITQQRVRQRNLAVIAFRPRGVLTRIFVVPTNREIFTKVTEFEKKTRLLALVDTLAQ